VVPGLLDSTCGIEQDMYWDSLSEALGDMTRDFRLDRMEGRTLAEQLRAWFGDYGVPVVVCAGYASQTLADEVANFIAADRRPAVLIYAGDFDPRGEDIARDFVERVGLFIHVERVAVLPGQIASLGLAPLQGKASDSRAARFATTHGQLVQAEVEVEAVDPNVLQGLYEDAFNRYWDMSTYEAVLAREEPMVTDLRAVIAKYEADGGSS
jgi:hypothetical protein